MAFLKGIHLFDLGVNSHSSQEGDIYIFDYKAKEVIETLKVNSSILNVV